jgi:Lon protease-like protein
MTERLPLFPLGTVLFPGLVLPLHIFEERYRALVRHMRRDDPDAGTFGVVAIQRGWETATLAPGGPDPEGQPVDGGPLELHEIGCTAEIRQLTEHSDGRFDIVTVGRRRFRIVDVHEDEAPFLIADIDWLPEADESTPEADNMMPALLELFQRYLEMIRTDGQAGGEQLPDDPTVLSYIIAATAVLTVDDRQRLLAAPTTLERLQLERRLLSREMAILRQVRALPVPLGDLATTPSPN